MSSPSCCSVLLIVTGVDVDPDVVTTQLGIDPFQTWRRGEQRVFRWPDGSVRTFSVTHDESGWKATASEALRHSPLDEQFDWWIAQLRARAEEVKKLREEGAEIRLNCFAATSEGLVLPSTLLAELGTWGVDLDVTFSAGGTE